MKTRLRAVSSVVWTLAPALHPEGREATQCQDLRWNRSSGLLRLDFGVRFHREGEAPAEPLTGVDASPGSRLSRSFALPGGPGSTPKLSVDEALNFNAFILP